MRYAEIQPSEDLKRYVQCYWMLETEAGDPVSWPTYPRGNPELVITLSGTVVIDVGGSSSLKTGNALLVGLQLEPVALSLPPPAKCLGVRFTANGASEYFCMSQQAMVGRWVALSEVSRGLANELIGSDGVSPPRSIADMERALRRHAPSARSDSLTLELLHSIRTSFGTTRVLSLYRSLQYSSKASERRFRHAVGISAKRYARLVRFNAALAMVKRSGTQASGTKLLQSLSEIAAHLDFSDQAHMTREFQVFAHATPLLLAGGKTNVCACLCRLDPTCTTPPVGFVCCSKCLFKPISSAVDFLQDAGKDVG